MVRRNTGQRRMQRCWVSVTANIGAMRAGVLLLTLIGLLELAPLADSSNLRATISAAKVAGPFTSINTHLMDELNILNAADIHMSRRSEEIDGAFSEQQPATPSEGVNTDMSRAQQGTLASSESSDSAVQNDDSQQPGSSNVDLNEGGSSTSSGSITTTSATTTTSSSSLNSSPDKDSQTASPESTRAAPATGAKSDGVSDASPAPDTASAHDLPTGSITDPPSSTEEVRDHISVSDLSVGAEGTNFGTTADDLTAASGKLSDSSRFAKTDTSKAGTKGADSPGTNPDSTNKEAGESVEEEKHWEVYTVNSIEEWPRLLMNSHIAYQILQPLELNSISFAQSTRPEDDFIAEDPPESTKQEPNGGSSDGKDGKGSSGSSDKGSGAGGQTRFSSQDGKLMAPEMHKKFEDLKLHMLSFIAKDRIRSALFATSSMENIDSTGEMDGFIIDPIEIAFTMTKFFGEVKERLKDIKEADTYYQDSRSETGVGVFVKQLGEAADDKSGLSTVGDIESIANLITHSDPCSGGGIVTYIVFPSSLSNWAVLAGFTSPSFALTDAPLLRNQKQLYDLALKALGRVNPDSKIIKTLMGDEPKIEMSDENRAVRVNCAVPVNKDTRAEELIQGDESDPIWAESRSIVAP